MATKRRVASTNDVHRTVKLVADGEYAVAEIMVQCRGLRGIHAPRVGEDETGRTWRSEAGPVILWAETGDNRDIVNGLGAGGVVVKNGDPAAYAAVSLADPGPGIWLDT